ncbi:hypothetical protein Tco_0333248 [Tanacetum coccineum]
MRNTLGKEKILQDMEKHASDAAVREYCDRNYHQLLLIIAEKVHQEKVQQEKLKAVKAHINFEEFSQHFKLGTPSRRKNLRRLGPRRVCSVSGSPEPRHDLPESPRKKDPERKRCSKGWKRAPALEEQSLLLKNIITKEQPHTRRKLYQKAKVAHEDTGSQGQKSKGQALKMTIYPNHGFKVESRDVKGAPEIMRISRFMHRITNPELIKRLHDKIPKSVDEMMRITTSFHMGEVAASNQERKKSLPPWKHQEAGHKQNFKKGAFKNQ